MHSCPSLLLQALLLLRQVPPEAPPAPAPAAPAAAPARRALTAEDLWAFQRVGAPCLAPDGKTAVVPVTRYSMADNKGNSDLWLVRTDAAAAPRRLTWNEGADAEPAFAPDGAAICFSSKRGDGPAQLYLLPLAGGEAERLTDLPVAVQGPRWFPDGARILFAAETWPDLDADFAAVKKRLDQRKDDRTKAEVSENRLFRYWDHWLTDGKATHLFALDLASRKITDLTPGSKRILAFEDVAGAFDVAPDGREIAFSANATEPPYQTLNFDLFLLDVATLAVRDVSADNPADDVRPRYSPDGKCIVFGRQRRPEIESDFVRLARLDRASGAILPILDGWDGQASEWTFTPDGETVLFHAELRGKVHLWSTPVEGPAPAPNVVGLGGSTGGVAAGPDGMLVYTWQTLVHAPELHRVQVGGGEVVKLTHFNDELAAGLDLGTVEDLTFNGAGGEAVQMFVLYPPGFDPARKWPLVHMIHGGPHGAFNDAFHFRWNQALFAAPGYVVAAVNFHGSTGRGQAFADSILGNHGDKPFEDLMKATDELIAKGSIDPARMAAAGGSYGGYMVAWILGHTDRFRCLVDHAGVYDTLGQFASDATWGRSNNYGAAPWQDPARIEQFSPAHFAANFKTPTLILHGEKDYRVPYTQGLNLHGVLTGKGVPSRLVLFPDENHWVLKPQAARLWWTEVHGWLERWIGKGPTG